MHVIQIGHISVELNERFGGEITRLRYRDRDLLAAYNWSSPVGVSRSVSYGDAKRDWLSEYRGGWQLLVPNAGAGCEVDGIPLPFHGEWSRTRVTVTERAADRVVMAAGTRLPLSVERDVRVVAQPERLLVRTTVTNSADRPVHFIWGEHPAFAVSEGDEIDIPPTRVYGSDGADLGEWPPRTLDGRRLDRVETSRPDESVHYLTGLREGWAAIRRHDHGLALAWNVEDFPYAWLWREIGSPGFPFYGRASLVALEPASSWPGDGLSGAIERGQAIRLQPHERRSTAVALIPFELRGRAVVGASVSGQIRWAPS